MSKRTKLRNREYRAAYAESYLDSLIATQIRVLREQRKLSQRELAELAGMKQSRISAMEDVNYCSWTVGTLKRLATAFDLPLIVRFESFGALRGEAAELTRGRLERPSFDEDPDLSGIQLTASIGLTASMGFDSAYPGGVLTVTTGVVIDAQNSFGLASENVLDDAA